MSGVVATAVVAVVVELPLAEPFEVGVVVGMLWWNKMPSVQL